MDADTQAAIEYARKKLQSTGIFVYDSPEELDEGEDMAWLQTINLNDVFAWATADCECVPDEELPRLSDLYFRYGWCGVLYWVSKRRGWLRSEFRDINRMIDFVRHEEDFRTLPTSTQAAYEPLQYVLGGERCEN